MAVFVEPVGRIPLIQLFLGRIIADAVAELRVAQTDKGMGFFRERMEQTAGGRFTIRDHLRMVFKNRLCIFFHARHIGDLRAAHLFTEVFAPCNAPLRVAHIHRRNCVVLAIDSALFPGIFADQITQFGNSLVHHIRNIVPCAVVSKGLILIPHRCPDQVDLFAGRKRQIIAGRPVVHNLNVNRRVNQLVVQLIGCVINHIRIGSAAAENRVNCQIDVFGNVDFIAVRIDPNVAVSSDSDFPAGLRSRGRTAGRVSAASKYHRGCNRHCRDNCRQSGRLFHFVASC